MPSDMVVIYWIGVYIFFLFGSVSVKSSVNTDNIPLSDIQLNPEKKPLVSPVSYQHEYSKNYINYLTVAEFDAVPK